MLFWIQVDHFMDWPCTFFPVNADDFISLVHKLMEMHESSGTTTAAPTTDGGAGFATDRPEGYEPPVLEAV